MSEGESPEPFDIVIIGGGINGCGIARDAAGRGLRVFLCEQHDLASATSSASTKLIHGGLRYLEYYKFRLVREALTERETLWHIAPHIIWPLRFVLPHHKGLRPAWLVRLGLFLYDHLGGRKRLPATKRLDLRRDPAGVPLKPDNLLAFEYSDCWVEDARLVVLNAQDAAAHGAEIAPRTRCTRGVRENGLWHLTLNDERLNRERTVTAKVVINAAGPWVASVLSGALDTPAKEGVRLVKGSHIVVPKIFDHDRCYFFQNADQRIFFAIPYEYDFTLIGTTDLDYHGDLDQVAISSEEIDYLCKAASDYFIAPITRDQVVWTYAGVRPLYDDHVSEAKAATRDYVLKLDTPVDGPALLSIYGGKITTYRRLAEAALAMLAPYLPQANGQPQGWTGRAALPGGDFPMEGFGAQVAALHVHYPFLTQRHAERLVRAYGTHAGVILREAASLHDLGQSFGADLYEAEVRYLVKAEWATTAEDILWRRSKLGLRVSAADAARLSAFLVTLRGETPKDVAS